MDEEIDLATLRPTFRAWLIRAADENFDRMEAAHGDQAATVAIITELMTADVVYGAWEDRDNPGAFRFVLIKGRDLHSNRARKRALVSVLPCVDRETAMEMARDVAARLSERPPEGTA